MPQLEILWTSVEEKPRQSSVVLILLLLLSEDVAFNSLIQSIHVPKVTWVKERRLTDISFASLLVSVLLRVARLSLTKLQDAQFLKNCLAIFSNLSPHLEQLHSYPAHSLFKFIQLLVKRLQRSHPELVASSSSIDIVVKEPESLEEILSHIPEPPGDFPKEASEEDEHVAQTFETLLTTVNTMLINNLSHQEELIYAILYQQNLFKPFVSHPRFGYLASNLNKVIIYFTDALESSGLEEWTQQNVLKVIREKSKMWKEKYFVPILPLRFNYEGEHSRDFFTLYAWEVIRKHSGLPWSST